MMQQVLIDKAKSQLEPEKEEIRQLERQLEMSNGPRFRKNSRFWDLVDMLDADSPRGEIKACYCTICTVNQTHADYKEALKMAETYKNDMYNKFGTSQGCKSTLDIERERIKEQ